MNFQVRLMLTFALCALIVVVSNRLNPPPEAPTDQDAIAASDDDANKATDDTDEGEDSEERPEAARDTDAQRASAEPAKVVPEQTGVLDNGTVRLHVTNVAPHRGGIIENAELLDGQFVGHDTATQWLKLENGRTLEVSFADDAADFVIPRGTVFEVHESTERKWVLGYRGADVEVTETLELLEGYQAQLTVEVRNVGTKVQAHRASVAMRIGKGESSRFDIHRGLCRAQDGLEYEAHSDVEEGPETYAGPVAWGGVDSKYFVSALIPEQPASHCEIAEESEGAYLRTTLTGAVTELGPGKSASHRFGLFLGAKSLERLQAYGAIGADHAQLEEAIDWGWFGGLSAVLGKLLLQLLRWFHELTGIWGVAILLLTVVVKGVTLPLTLKQMSSMKRMKEIQPQVEELKKKYADDRVKQGQEMQALFARSGANPLAGCLPMLVQFPVWIALYAMLSTAVELIHESFLWLPDLTQQDPYYLLPISMGGLMVVQNTLMPQTGMDPAQAKMMRYAMPVIFTFFMLFLPSGLALYIFANIALSIVQTLIQVGTTKTADGNA